eukprot:CAMPEP_0170544162 /NCGR_PEP_ID=MMETSP0211-20121228/3033_1 /TAXON_ID=311385 /ORGANISM="Pseudokeronopsis sp., Strain OXSARD2" /LENGTH=44 /DNA_ID= /DNA_START= /DNA_END= /DNA_ORIENTATION=
MSTQISDIQKEMDDIRKELKQYDSLVSRKKTISDEDLRELIDYE